MYEYMLTCWSQNRAQWHTNPQRSSDSKWFKQAKLSQSLTCVIQYSMTWHDHVYDMRMAYVYYMYDLWTPMYDLIMTYGSVAILWDVCLPSDSRSLAEDPREPVVTAKGLCKGYGDRLLISDADFEFLVRACEFESFHFHLSSFHPDSNRNTRGLKLRALAGLSRA
jgi:hypothetical protein